MTPLRTRLADMWADWHIWLDRRSNWQFVAFMAIVNVVVYVVVAFVPGLSDYVSLRTFITTGVLDTIAFTAFFAWRRWR
jgi:hypothetical protein